jgi:hypothetical protein
MVNKTSHILKIGDEMKTKINASAFLEVNQESYDGVLEEIARVSEQDIDEELITPGTESITQKVHL